MKTLHLSLTVESLQDSVTFYSTLFGSAPTMQKDDYAQWLLNDPHVNFSIASRGGTPGFNHVGIQVENDEEFNEMHERILATDGILVDQGQTVCCYAESNKNWITDPQQIRWEVFHTTRRTEHFGDNTGLPETSGDCCDDAVVEATHKSATPDCLPNTDCC